MLDREYYLPAPEHLAVQSTGNRQGRGELLSGEDAARVLALLRQDAERCHAHYEEMLDENGFGLARELARINLTLATYTQWYWKIDLHNLLHFLALRADTHAQYEIRVYAEAMLKTVRRWVPLAHAAFVKNRLGAATLSAPALAVVRRMIAGEVVTPSDSGLSAREWRELMSALRREE